MQFQCLSPAESQTIKQLLQPEGRRFTFAFEKIAINGRLIDYLLSDTEVASAKLLVS